MRVSQQFAGLVWVWASSNKLQEPRITFQSIPVSQLLQKFSQSLCLLLQLCIPSAQQGDLDPDMQYRVSGSGDSSTVVLCEQPKVPVGGSIPTTIVALIHVVCKATTLWCHVLTPQGGLHLPQPASLVIASHIERSCQHSLLYSYLYVWCYYDLFGIPLCRTSGTKSLFTFIMCSAQRQELMSYQRSMKLTLPVRYHHNPIEKYFPYKEGEQNYA